MEEGAAGISLLLLVEEIYQKKVIFKYDYFYGCDIHPFFRQNE